MVICDSGGQDLLFLVVFLVIVHGTADDHDFEEDHFEKWLVDVN